MNENVVMNEFEVGKRYPDMQTNQCFAKLDFDGGWRLISAMPRLTGEEIKDFKSGTLQIGMAEINGKIFILNKFGNQPWSDTPYEPRLYPEALEYPQMESSSMGALLQVELYDSATGVLKVLRLIGLPNELSNQLHSRCTELAAMEQMNQATNNWQVAQIYKKYRKSEDMLKQVKKVYIVGKSVPDCIGS